MLGNATTTNHWILKRLSYIIDTTLLTAAILLAIVIQQYPFVQGWLTMKLLLLPVYVVLGMFALRRGKTRRVRAGFFAAALAVYAFIVSVAVMHDPRGWFASMTIGRWRDQTLSSPATILPIHCSSVILPAFSTAASSAGRSASSMPSMRFHSQSGVSAPSRGT